MNAPLMLVITATLMLSVPTPLVVSPVPVTWATAEMDSPVWVSVKVRTQRSWDLLYCTSIVRLEPLALYADQSIINYLCPPLN